MTKKTISTENISGSIVNSGTVHGSINNHTIASPDTFSTTEISLLLHKIKNSLSKETKSLSQKNISLLPKLHTISQQKLLVQYDLENIIDNNL